MQSIMHAEQSVKTEFAEIFSLLMQTGVDMQEEDQQAINTFNKGWQKVKELQAELDAKKVHFNALKSFYLWTHLAHASFSSFAE